MDMKIADRLQKLRKEQGFSQEQLADELGVSRQAISKWERGEASPDTENLILLAKLYKMPIDNLLFEGENSETDSEATSGAASEIARDDGAVDCQREDVTKHSDSANGASGKPAGNHGSSSLLTGIAVFVAVIAYCLLGSLLNAWHPAWLVFFIIPLTPTMALAIESKDPNIFPYPVFVAAIYLTVGCIWGIWHPTWAVFLTIPVYYILIDAIFVKK